MLDSKLALAAGTKMSKKLAIYLTNTDTRGWDADYADYAVMTADLLAPLLPDYEIDLFDAVAGTLPTQPCHYDGVVLTGSVANVTEPEPWMQTLYEHIRRLDAAQVKLVGICFGHQAIIHALGGSVEAAQPQVGIAAINVKQRQAWMQPWQPQVALLCGNFKQVLSLPEGFKILANHAHCRVPLYGKGEHILGCQYHPEFSIDYMRLYTDQVAAKIGPELTDKARQQLAGDHDGALFARWIANFLQA